MTDTVRLRAMYGALYDKVLARKKRAGYTSDAPPTMEELREAAQENLIQQADAADIKREDRNVALDGIFLTSAAAAKREAVPDIPSNIGSVEFALRNQRGHSYDDPAPTTE